MTNRIATLSALLFAACSSAVLASQPQPDDLDQRVRCSAVFAALARDQFTKQPGADAYPAMEGPGKAFFVATGIRLFAARQLDEATFRVFMKAEVSKLQREVAEAKDPKAHFDAAFRSCQHYLAESTSAPAG